MSLRFVDGRVEDEAAKADELFVALFGAAAMPPMEGPGDLVEAVLRFHDAPPALVRQVLAGRRQRTDGIRMLSAGLKAALLFARLPGVAQSRLMLIGPPGAGKTTMMAKLAARSGAPAAAIFSTDCDRPGGFEQLADPLSVLGIDAQRLDIDEAPGDFPIEGPVLIDTGGTDADQGFEKLGQLAQILAIEPVLVLPATIDPDEAGKFARAALAVGATKLLITRLDMARRLGGPLNAAFCGLAIAGSSVTPHFAFGLKPLGVAALARHLFALAQRPPAVSGTGHG